MPNITIPISDLLTTVERPVIFDVIRQVQDLTGISSKTQIRYYGEDAKAAQWNSTITKDASKHNLWPHVENLSIEVEDDYAVNRMLSIAVKQPEVPFVFIDEALGMYVKPVYSPQETTIRFKYVTKDRNQAVRWRNEIRTRTAMNRDINMHTVTYGWRFPDVYLDILKSIHTLREAIDGYGDTFERYFDDHTTDRMTTLTNLSATVAMLSVAETQTGIQGFFDFEGVPDKPEKGEEADVWTISFSYKFTYDKPINTVFNYPFLVHQQLIDEKYRFPINIDTVEQQWLSKPSSAQAFANFEISGKEARYRADQGLVIPNFDDFQPNSIPPSTLRVFTALTSITPQDKKTLLNLGELGDFNLDPDILDFIRTEEYTYMDRVYNSIFCLNLYSEQYLQQEICIRITPNLDVLSLVDLDLRKKYHLRLSMVADMTYLTPGAVSRLKKYPGVLDKIVRSINLALLNSSNQSDVGNTLRDYDYYVLGFGRGRPLVHGTLVQTLFITANRTSQYEAPKPLPPTAVNPYAIL